MHSLCRTAKVTLKKEQIKTGIFVIIYNIITPQLITTSESEGCFECCISKMNELILHDCLSRNQIL